MKLKVAQRCFGKKSPILSRVAAPLPLLETMPTIADESLD
jgi:hypothetical protein